MRKRRPPQPHLPEKGPAVVLLFLLLTLSLTLSLASCAELPTAEDSGATLAFALPSQSCDFALSPDGRWLVATDLVRTTDAASGIAHSVRRPVLVDRETGRPQDLTFAAQADTLRKRGLEPQGVGCFNRDASALYFARTHHTEGRLERAAFALRLDAPPLTVRAVAATDCHEPDASAPPPIRREQHSAKEIQLYHAEGHELAVHRPHSGLSQRIHLYAPDDRDWQRSYTPSLDGEWLAYRISERGVLGFSAPAVAYVVRIRPPYRAAPYILGRSLHAMVWGSEGALYACSRYGPHERAIVRWDRDLFE